MFHGTDSLLPLSYRYTYYSKESSSSVMVLRRSFIVDRLDFKQLSQCLLHHLTPFAEKLHAFMQWPFLKSGAFLALNEGHRKHGSYILLSGRIKELKHRDEREFLANDIIGLHDAILTSNLGKVSSNAGHKLIAAKNSELCYLPKELTWYLCHEFPAVQNRLIYTISEQLTQMWSSKINLSKSTTTRSIRREPRTSADWRPEAKVIAIFSAKKDTPLTKFTRELERALALYATVLRINSKQLKSLKSPDFDLTSNFYSWTRELERDKDVILFQCDLELTQWTKWCLSEADLILSVALASSSPEVTSQESAMSKYVPHVDKYLILLHPTSTSFPQGKIIVESVWVSQCFLNKNLFPGTSEWLDKRPYVTLHHHVKMVNVEQKDMLHSDLARLARKVTNREVGLVLGGGGARGAAHVGLLAALQEANIPIDHIGGVSIGAFVGGLWAMHRDPQMVKKIARRWFAIFRTEWFSHCQSLTYPHTSYFTGDSFNDSLKVSFGEDIMIEDLWIPFFCCTTNLTTGSERVHT